MKGVKRVGKILLICAGALVVFLVTGFMLRDTRPVLVCIGDSLTSCGGPGGHYCDALTRLMPDVRIVDAGIGGDTLDGGRARFSRDVLRHHPKVVVIELGANDFWRAERPASEMAADLEFMITSAQAQGAAVVVAGCFGGRDFWQEVCTEFEVYRFPLAAEIAAMESRLCRQYHCLYIPNIQVDVKPNRLPPYWDETDHPNSLGNVQVALRMLPVLRQALKER